MASDNIFSGLKVVDLSSFIAGPSAATILSDFGADVIKVEPPQGELWRIGNKIPPQPIAPEAYQCWGGRPPRHRCAKLRSLQISGKEAIHGPHYRIGMDTSKHVFQLHGVNAAEEPVLRRKLRRNDMVVFFERLAPTTIAIEAAGASHHWARLLRSFGHEVKLIAPQLVKPYVKRGKNDAADAEALCEAMSRPTMRFVPVKTAERQAALMLLGLRDRLVRNRTQLANAIRGYAAEFGLAAAKGIAHLAPLLTRIQSDESLPGLARELFAAHAPEYAQLAEE